MSVIGTSTLTTNSFNFGNSEEYESFVATLSGFRERYMFFIDQLKTGAVVDSAIDIQGNVITNMRTWRSITEYNDWMEFVDLHPITATCNIMGWVVTTPWTITT